MSRAIHLTRTEPLTDAERQALVSLSQGGLSIWLAEGGGLVVHAEDLDDVSIARILSCVPGAELGDGQDRPANLVSAGELADVYLELADVDPLEEGDAGETLAIRPIQPPEAGTLSWLSPPSLRGSPDDLVEQVHFEAAVRNHAKGPATVHELTLCFLAGDGSIVHVESACPGVRFRNVQEILQSLYVPSGVLAEAKAVDCYLDVEVANRWTLAIAELSAHEEGFRVPNSVTMPEVVPPAIAFDVDLVVSRPSDGQLTMQLACRPTAAWRYHSLTLYCAARDSNRRIVLRDSAPLEDVQDGHPAFCRLELVGADAQLRSVSALQFVLVGEVRGRQFMGRFALGDE